MAESPRAKPAVERVTEKKAKDPKKVAAGRAQTNGTSVPPKAADRERTNKRPEHNRNWIPWIIGACLAGGSLAYISRNMRLRASPSSVAAGPAPKVQDKPLYGKPSAQ